MSTITIDPADDVIIVIPGLCEIFATGAGFTLKPAGDMQGEQLSDKIVFSRQKGPALPAQSEGVTHEVLPQRPILPLLSETLEEAALLSYMGGRPAVEQLRKRLELLVLNYPAARLANSITPHADVLPYRWTRPGSVSVPEQSAGYPEEAVGYVFYARWGQAMHATIWSDGTVGAGVPFDWPDEAGQL